MAEKGGDPFEGVRLDDEFIRGAAKRELSADERVQRASSARGAHDALLRQRAAEQPAKRRRRFGGHGGAWWRNRALIGVVVLVGVIAWRFDTAVVERTVTGSGERPSRNRSRARARPPHQR
jgi:hypothetical protein